MTEYKTIPDADLSNAGDDFHVLWVIKKSLELLNFNKESLKALTIEGYDNYKSKELDPTGVKFLGIDLTEYYGGNDFENSESIIISQLKYSTRRIHENYTFSKLYEGKKAKSHDGSIIHRFASIFKTFLNEYGRENVLKKIKIKLVSNRNINISQLSQIIQIQDYLFKNKRELSFNTVLKKFPLIPTEPFSKLREASKLNLYEFTDFIRLLDFTDCGVSSRQTLKFELIKSIASTSTKSHNQFNSLFQMIWNKMMPEKREERTLTFIDIVANFGFNCIEDLFPVSQNFENNHNTIEREQLKNIISVIENTTSLPICIHGGAGIGKSTIVNQIKNSLPEYTECILFDCYGAGKYQSPEDKRHLHKNAIVQLSNELAKKTGTEFLLLQNESNDNYLKEFIKRIRHGVEILRKRNPAAYLVFIIDAADNSVTAANHDGKKSFVEELINIEIPVGCHIIATSRSYRKDSLNLPDNHISIELKPFSLEETTLFMNNNFSNVNEKEIINFHEYTNGIPRVQFYSLNLKNQGINSIINYLKPHGKNVEDLIIDKIEQAKTRIGKERKYLVDQFFRLLISLPRPVPMSYLSEIMEVNIEFLKDLSSDIWNGLILENHYFSFRDEDFENFINETYQISIEEQESITKMFLSKSETEEYASVNLGNFLFNSDYKNELVDIVLNKKLLTFPKDPIRNKEVYISRTKLALKVSQNIQDDLTYFKLLFIAAEESKTDKALIELLINYPDLVSRFGDEVSLARLISKSDEKPWAGAFYLKLAGIYSRKLEQRELSLKYLRTANEWLNWRKHRKEEELNDYPITSIDIAYQTEAILRLYGLDKALKAINRWIPKEARLSAGNHLVENIICFSTKSEIDNWLKYKNFRFDVKLFIICKLYQYQRPLHFDLKNMAYILVETLSKKEINLGEKFFQLIVQFCKILAQHGIDEVIIIKILHSIKLNSPKTIPYFYNEYSDKKEEILFDITLSKETLISSLKNERTYIEQFYPDKFKDIDKINDYQKRNAVERDKSEFDTFYQYAISIYQLHSDILKTQCSQSENKVEFEKICNKIVSDYNFKQLSNFKANDRLLFLFGKLGEIALLFDNKEKFINYVIDTCSTDSNRLRLRFEILNKIILLKDLTKLSYNLLHELDLIIKNLDLSASEATENYIKCLILSSKLDNSFSKYFLEEAIKATSEIDYGALAQIRCIYDLSEIGITQPNPQLAYNYARFIEYCDIKLGKYDKKYFPYSQGLLGIGNIDMSSMFSTLCRWHHRNIIEIGSEINSLIKNALEKGYIDHLVTSSLINLKTHYNYEELENLYKLLILKFDEAGDSKLKTKFINLEFLNLRLQKDNHFLRKIFEEIKSGKFVDKDIVFKIKNYLDFLERIKITEDKEETDYNFKREDFKHNIDVTELDYTSTKEIEKAIDQIIVNNTNDYNSNWCIKNFLSDIKKICSPDKYVKFLNVLVDINERLLDFQSFKEIINNAIKEWDYYPEVKSWKREQFKYILSTKFKHFDYGNTLNIWSIRRFAELFFIENSLLTDIIIEIIPQKIDLLSDESMYSSFELIKSRLTPIKNEELLKWILEKWNSKIKTEIGDGLWTEELLPFKYPNENIAYLLKFMLGHPDKKLRWKAIHSIRRLVNLNNVEILKILLDKQNQKDCLPFQNKKYIYYWMSAKLYLWLAIDRISLENPKILIPLKDYFYNELLTKDFPHVLIKHYIKKSCLNLYNFDHSIYSEIEFQSIQDTNKTKLDYINEDNYTKLTKKFSQSSQKDWTFDFDTLDTLPHWYRDVGEIFSISEHNVADIADKYITEKWGYTGNVNKDDYIRTQLYENDWYLTRNDHGDNPQIEDLSIYFEYHSMYCAANFLLETMPLSENDFGYNWESWLNSKANAFENFWLSDLRTPLPLKLEYWKNNVEKFDEEWRDKISEEYFDENVGLLEEDKFLNLHGGITKNIGINQETISIRSCLVSTKGAEALLRALQTTKDSYDYSMPLEEDDEEFNEESIEQDEFSFKGWLQEIRSENEGLDSDDSLFNKTFKGYTKFGKKAHSHFDIKYDNLFRHSYFDNELISIYENWNEILDYKHDYRKYIKDLETSGSIFRVSSIFLLNLLRKEDKYLIIRCKIIRQLEERVFKNRYDDDTKNIKIYLINQNGTVRTLRGRDYKIG